MSRPRGTKRKRDDEPEMALCAVCHRTFDLSGVGNHQRVARRQGDPAEVGGGEGSRRGRASKEKMPLLRLTKAGTAPRRDTENIPPAAENEFYPQSNDFFPDNNAAAGPAPQRTPSPEPEPPCIESAHLPSHFILTTYHKHSGLPSKIVPLDGPLPPPKERPLAVGFNPAKPFAPFRVFADYHFTSKCVRRAESEAQIKEELDALHNEVWAGPCKLTIRTVKDMADSLAAARRMAVQFRQTTYRIEYEGRTTRFRGTHEIQFSFRDPWEVILHWLRDPTLVPYSNWFSARKFYCHGGETMEIVDEVIDEPYTAETWRQVDDELPDPFADDEHQRPAYPCVYLPIHIWLDKGQVSTKVKKHPVLMRGLWIDSVVRNASGNGGCALLAYIIMPPAVRNADRRNLSTAEKEDLVELQGLAYHGLNEHLLSSLKTRSHRGETLRFGDGVRRTGYPGIEIQSMDFQEIAAWLRMRASNALYSCPKCLVPKDWLYCLTRRFTLRTPRAMAKVVRKARKKSTKGDKEAVLKSAGLHDGKQILWGFRFSDPYKAVSYDTLHWDEGGKFGRHLWVYTKDLLTRMNRANEFNECMDQLPRWRDMDHIAAPTTIEFTEGETFLTLLKTILPGLVHLLPRNSPLIRALRALQQFRMLVGMHCMTGKRLALMKQYIKAYDLACREIDDKDFNFLKHHYTLHAPDDIRQKGTSNHMTTRTGEGFQQEVSRHYKHTSGVNAEQQMVLIDENEEVMAQLDMIVADDAERQRRAEADAEDDGDKIADPVDTADAPHWRLAAPNPKVAIGTFEAQMRNGPNSQYFDGFNMALRRHLVHSQPELQLSYESVIYIQSFRAIHVEYQSKVDWTGKRDILRCNPSFWHRPRYDCVIYNADVDPLSLARLLAIFRCTTHAGRSFDLAYVQRFKNSKWRPNTAWDGCRVVDPAPRAEFLPLEYVVRGAYLARASGTATDHYFPLDTIDDDMFLRLNNID
ncbi:hypothetical protein MKEN_00395100 [Mycena kentingensis (nom. inval.)]|nr:hypothetical protein MKEN_00395100 [Mycena kentingensis (nom. inval.)]